MSEPQLTEPVLDPESPNPNNNLAGASSSNNLTPRHKPSKKPIIIIGILLLLAIGATAIFFLTKDESQHKNQLNKTSQSAAPEAAEQKAVEQVFINPIDNSKTAINKEDYYVVAVGNSEYYGGVSKINNEYIRLSPTAYKQAGTLTFTGKELHGPLAATYFRVANVTKFQALTDTAILGAIKAADSAVSDASPSNDINAYVKGGQFQAYFFADGTAFFAKTTSLAGTFLAGSAHVYVLQANSSAGVHQQTSLVLAKPEQYNKRTANDLLYWQNMRVDSQISKAATAFENAQ